MQPPMRTSAIIPTLNEARVIERTLLLTVQQGFETIIVVESVVYAGWTWGL